jgi:hypothetical protein
VGWVIVPIVGAATTAFTVIVPVAETPLLHPPVRGIEYVKVPETVGVPLMLIVLELKEALTPVGKPVAVPIPVAPVVVCVMVVIALLAHTVGDDEATLTVLLAVTAIDPVVEAELVPHGVVAVTDTVPVPEPMVIVAEVVVPPEVIAQAVPVTDQV